MRIAACQWIGSPDRESQQRLAPTLTPRPSFHELAEKVTDKARQGFRAAYREELDGNRVETTDESINEVASQRAERYSPMPDRASEKYVPDQEGRR